MYTVLLIADWVNSSILVTVFLRSLVFLGDLTAPSLLSLEILVTVAGEIPSAVDTLCKIHNKSMDTYNDISKDVKFHLKICIFVLNTIIRVYILYTDKTNKC